jgi:hypothetical protein
MLKLIYWIALTWEGGFGSVYAKTEEDCIEQIKTLTEKGGKFGPHYKVEMEYVDDFDLMMQLFGYALKDGNYRPGVSMKYRS